MTEKPRAAGPEEAGPTPGGSAPSGAAEGRSGERIVIRDKRRIDPSGGRRAPAGKTAGPAGDGAPDGTDSRDEAAPAVDSSRENAAHAEGVQHPSEEDTQRPEAAGTHQEPGAGAAQPDAGARDGDQPESATDGGPAPSVVDERELSEVLADEKQPETPAPPVVDEPTPVSDGQPAGDVDLLTAELTALRAELEERTNDLQRITAEYANYRKRVERDRGLVAEQAIGNVLSALLPILDDLDRAREHGDLVGPFATVAEQLTAAVGKFGLTAFGEKGDPFDPTRHEAVAHSTSAEVSEPTCVEVMRRGYLLGERLLRPALVAVAAPE